MTDRKEFDFLIERLLARAVEEYRATEQYELCKEKTEQMERDCEGMFTKEEQRFATECFQLLLEADERQEEYVYRKGLRDCMSILKGLGVLA